MTDCSSVHGSTSSSSDVISSRGGVTTPRIRVVRMVRPSSRRVLLGPDNNVAFGFAIRGGKEFGTGFFVSKVEKNSEADAKGLRVGDQIIRVNGYHVDDAVHKELTQFISSQDRLTLKVRGVGMLPIKEKTIDPLTWHIVPRHVLSSIAGLEDFAPKDVRIVLKVAPRTKLGLGICKGPEWKPGIFVQFTKEFSVARDAGLRPGDQILSCNSIDFSDVLFSEAVAVMKSSQTLEMVVRTGAGLDLFPGESSGYNSSASSVTGDQSPCWGDQASKRLSMVREESQHWSDRITLDRRKNIKNSNELRPPASDSNKTIIQLSENGTLINNTLVPSSSPGAAHLPDDEENVASRQNCSSPSTGDGSARANFVTADHAAASNGDCGGSKVGAKIADICFVSRQSETKTVIVEVHRSAAEETNKAPFPTSVPAPPKPPALPNCGAEQHERSLSELSSISSCGTSLSSAINEEWKKRQERRSSDKSSNQANPQSASSESQSIQQPKRLGNPSVGGNDDEKRHSALMDEFKRAHRRMFKNGFREDEKEERKQELSRATVMEDVVDYAMSDYGKTDNLIQYPPPPPPPEFANCSSKFVKNNDDEYRTDVSAAPETPTPDYDSTPSHTLPNRHSGYCNGSAKSTIGRVAATEIAKANGHAAEMESIESYKLQNPSSPIPRPPSLYFKPQNSGPPTMKKTSRPVSVTIGEYGAQTSRKEPSKLDFIKSNMENNTNTAEASKDDNVSEMLRSELEKTLSRSNLRKRSETLGNLNGPIPNGKPVLQKTQSSNIEKIANMLQGKQNAYELNNNRSTTLVNTNRVTINIPNKFELRKTESNPPIPTNGILKNGYSKPSSCEKNITFGN